MSSPISTLERSERYAAAFTALDRHDPGRVLHHTVRGLIHRGQYHARRACPHLGRAARTGQPGGIVRPGRTPQSRTVQDRVGHAAAGVAVTDACLDWCSTCVRPPDPLLIAARRAAQAYTITRLTLDGHVDAATLAEHEHAVRARRTHLSSVSAVDGLAALAAVLDRDCADTLCAIEDRYQDPAHQRQLMRAVRAHVNRYRTQTVLVAVNVLRWESMSRTSRLGDLQPLLETVARTWLGHTDTGPDGLWRWGLVSVDVHTLLSSELTWTGTYAHAAVDTVSAELAETAFGLFESGDGPLNTLDAAIDTARRILG